MDGRTVVTIAAGIVVGVLALGLVGKLLGAL
jgi:hypothetical protein